MFYKGGASALEKLNSHTPTHSYGRMFGRTDGMICNEKLVFYSDEAFLNEVYNWMDM